MTQSLDENNLYRLIKKYKIVSYLLIVSMAVILFFIQYYIPEKNTPLRDLLVNLSGGMIVIAIIYFIVENALGSNRENKNQEKWEEITIKLNEAANKLDPSELLSYLTNEVEQATRKNSESINKINICDESGLFRYCDKIRNIPPKEWYTFIENADGDILLMSPSLWKWFEDKDYMINLLISKAMKRTKIKFLIMGSENNVCLEIGNLRLTRTRANVDFYRYNELKKNEEDIKTILSEVNRSIKRISDSQSNNYVELKKVTHSPIFIKAEFFGTILHWSFFGYNIDGQLAPSFWCKKGDNRGNQTLYQVIKTEFETMWSNGSISEQIDVVPS